jgi:hypothetical protein
LTGDARRFGRGEAALGGDGETDGEHEHGTVEQRLGEEGGAAQGTGEGRQHQHLPDRAVADRLVPRSPNAAASVARRGERTGEVNDPVDSVREPEDGEADARRRRRLLATLRSVVGRSTGAGAAAIRDQAASSSVARL